MTIVTIKSPQGVLEWSEDLVGHKCPQCGASMLSKEEWVQGQSAVTTALTLFKMGDLEITDSPDDPRSNLKISSDKVAVTDEGGSTQEFDRSRKGLIEMLKGQSYEEIAEGIIALSSRAVALTKELEDTRILLERAKSNPS